MLQELVDKVTPKKILRTVNDNGEPFLPRGYGECPKCKTVVDVIINIVVNVDKDWSDEE